MGAPIRVQKINMSDTFYILASQVVLYGCMIYLIFFKEYIKRKGSNLADKEDIEGITQKIEQVKNQFTQENEFLKSNLQFIITNQLQNTNEERNAIIKFSDSHSIWLNVGLQDVIFNGYQNNNIEELIQKNKQLDDFFTQTNVAQNRISLLVDNNEIIQVSNQLIIKTLEYNHWTKNLLSRLRFNIEENKSNLDHFLELYKIKPTPPEIQKIVERQKELKEERKQLNDSFYTDKINKYKEVLEVSSAFSRLVKAYLKKSI